MSRPTPETDDAWACFKGYMEPLQDVKDLSRKLERERDEAREKAERYRIEANAMMMQRDEAREALRMAIRFVEAYEPHTRGVEADQNETLSIIRKALEETK